MADDEISRRKFIEAGITGAAALPVAGALLSACGKAGTTAPGTGDPGATTDSNNLLTLPFSSFSGLQTAGGSARLSVTTASKGTQVVSVTRVSATSAVTVSAVCTHQGCEIGDYASSSQEYTCPCHGSVFSASGAVVNGPASEPLPTFTTAITSTGLTVQF
jgi:cytochrome b6-f complex iron-sulfur subunit